MIPTPPTHPPTHLPIQDTTFAPFSTLEGMTGKPAPAGAVAGGAQDFLEANPYYDQSNIPLNTYKNKEPHTGKVVSVKRIVGPKATGTSHPPTHPFLLALL